MFMPPAWQSPHTFRNPPFTSLLTITSREKPLEFLVDPDRRVPQTDIQNDHWPLAPN